jgi:MFS transporter, MHS family, proline/betaine transporter
VAAVSLIVVSAFIKETAGRPLRRFYDDPVATDA